MGDVERVSAALRWPGRVLTVAGAVMGLVPVSDDCGSVFQPTGIHASGLVCTSALSGRQDTVVLLLVVGVALMLAGQVVAWRRRPS
ncbi:hypothetical protein ACGFX4_19935 [Kitasatospora sp. NPDC048365]|uniref:hypothetical protein n=1 Tax=Kitasatospora sp. NPDC048365 TaxID=3364050 RepID=UPI00371D79E0